VTADALAATGAARSLSTIAGQQAGSKPLKSASLNDVKSNTEEPEEAHE
jgi:hypothetical protein